MNLVTHAFNLAYESEPKPAGLVGYSVCKRGGVPPSQGAMYDYVFAADGVYLHAEREELEVCFRVAPAEVRGLDAFTDMFAFRLPKVPEELMYELWRRAGAWANDRLETLFHLVHSPVYPWNDGWELIEPEQTRTSISCKPDEPCQSAERAVIEIHSHHSMPARFSGTDDKDETGFRLYGVIGKLLPAPEIRMRVGVYGAGFWEIPATWALELPDGLTDCNPESDDDYSTEEILEAALESMSPETARKIISDLSARVGKEVEES